MGSIMSSMWTTLFGEVPVPPPPELDSTLRPFPKYRNIEHRSKDWSSKEIQDQLPADILLLTANDNEFLACYWYMKKVQLSSHNDGQGIISVFFGQFQNEDNQNGRTNVKVALMKCAQGQSNAMMVSMRGIQILNPKVVICVGICATMKPNKAKLGDVVISSRLTTYDDKKVEADGNDEYRGPINIPVPVNMANFIQFAENGWKAPLKDENSLQVNVYRDVILSGSTLIDNVEKRDELATRFNPLGLEMEGAGLFKAAYLYGIEWAVIKAVSDLADGSKQNTEEWQPFASAMAASLVHHMFKDPSKLDGWRRHKETGHARVMTTSNGAHEQPQDISDTGDAVPMDHYLLELAQRIPDTWRKLGIRLNVEDSEIRAIRLNNQSDVVWQAYEMLRYSYENCRDQPAQSWCENLRRALRQIGKNRLAASFTCTGHQHELN